MRASADAYACGLAEKKIIRDLDSWGNGDVRGRGMDDDDCVVVTSVGQLRTGRPLSRMLFIHCAAASA
jgi:hypothetical protein